MNIIDRLQQIAHFVELFLGAFSYFLVSTAVIASLLTFGFCLWVLKMGHHPYAGRYMITALACLVIAFSAIALGMWSYSDMLAEQARWSTSTNVLDWQ